MSAESQVDRRTVLLLSGAAAIAASLSLPETADAAALPRLEKALEQMKDAKTFLEEATSGFGGHKRKAIQALTTAIAEIENCIANGKK